ncbi:MAG TPA: rhomboid family intramembrane serine protease [Puia sp.]|nr:rhomboid family intramembrane serine protease [Puia sp.]
MAFGLTPKYSKDIYLDGLEPAQFLALCVIVARELGWDIRHISDAGLIAYTPKKLFSSTLRATIRIDGEMVHLKSECTGNEMADLGRNRRNVEQFRDQLIDAKLSHSAEQLAQTYEELKPELVAPEHDILVNPPQKGSGIFGLLVPREGFFVTPIIMDINIAVFILMVITGASILQPDTQTIIAWGGNIRPLTMSGQWWRIITNIFVHIGIIHILMNMYALLYIGILLEPIMGKFRFLVAYLLTGITASLTSMYWHDDVVSAGASGAIFGMYGVFLALLTTNLVDRKKRTALLSSIGIFVFYNLAYGMKGGVDNAAHVGGLVSGLLIGYMFYPGLKSPDKPKLRYSAAAIAAVLVGSVVVIGFKTIPNGYPQFQEKMNTVVRLQEQATEVFRNEPNESKAEFANGIRATAIPNCVEAIRILKDARQLDVPELMKRRTGALIQYCNALLDFYNYGYRKTIDSTGSIKDSTAYFSLRLNDLKHSLDQ